MENKYELSGLYYSGVIQRFEQIEDQFPGLIELAINIKKLPREYVEPGKKPDLRLRFLLSEELRENTNRFLKGRINSIRMENFIKKTSERINNALNKNVKRKELINNIIKAEFINQDNKNKILKILSK